MLKYVLKNNNNSYKFGCIAHNFKKNISTNNLFNFNTKASLNMNVQSANNNISLKPYNNAFFGLWENFFLTASKRFSKAITLEVGREMMKNALTSAYDKMGFTQGSVEDFMRVLKERDNAVGLDVDFQIISKNEIIYVFKTDPFPGLKNSHFSIEEIYSTFIPVKIEHILGQEWKYKIIHDGWIDGNNNYTSVKIFKG